MLIGKDEIRRIKYHLIRIMNIYFKQYLYESKNLEFKDFFLTYIIGNNQSLKLNFSAFIPKILTIIY